METRDLALSILSSPDLEVKLRRPGKVTDRDPGPPLRVERPARPRGLEIVSSRAARVPAIEGMADPRQRPRILHALANHELQAVELFAWALLAFPEAPPEFRSGLVRILGEEIGHCRLYLARLAGWGTRLGDHPVTGYFWSKVPGFATPLQFACGMGLTFENANLDHTLEYARAARASGDERTARILDRVHADEQRHVRFGLEWLLRWKDPGSTAAEAYCENVRWPLRAALARGAVFHPEAREAAGLDAEFVRLLARADRREDSRPRRRG
jgi:uncharacterized ferritin-like protein (DUF455 family)